MPEDDFNQQVQELWRAQEGECVDITSDEIGRRARTVELEGMAFYWAAWILIPIFAVLLIRNRWLLKDPLLIAGTTLASATLLLIAGTIVRSRPLRVSPAEPCLEFLRRALEAKQRGMRWIGRFILLGFAAIACCAWSRAHSAPLPFVGVTAALAFCWWAFYRERRRLLRQLHDLMPK